MAERKSNNVTTTPESTNQRSSDDPPKKPTEGAVTRKVNTSVDSNCPICLNAITDRAKTDTCLHEFCRNCITEWSSHHNQCPSCRQVYHNVLFNIKSDTEFEQIPVEEPRQEIGGGDVIILVMVLMQLLGMIHQAEHQRDTVQDVINNLTQALENTAGQEESNQLQTQLDAAQERLTSLNEAIEGGHTTANEISQILNEAGIQIQMQIQPVGIPDNVAGPTSDASNESESRRGHPEHQDRGRDNGRGRDNPRPPRRRRN